MPNPDCHPLQHFLEESNSVPHRFQRTSGLGWYCYPTYSYKLLEPKLVLCVIHGGDVWVPHGFEVDSLCFKGVFVP